MSFEQDAERGGGCLEPSRTSPARATAGASETPARLLLPRPTQQIRIIMHVKTSSPEHHCVCRASAVGQAVFVKRCVLQRCVCVAAVCVCARTCARGT